MIFYLMKSSWLDESYNFSSFEGKHMQVYVGTATSRGEVTLATFALFEENIWSGPLWFPPASKDA